jgi:hypothetical protein
MNEFEQSKNLEEIKAKYNLALEDHKSKLSKDLEFLRSSTIKDLEIFKYECSHEVPPVFRLPKGEFHATSFSCCCSLSQFSMN